MDWEPPETDDEADRRERAASESAAVLAAQRDLRAFEPVYRRYYRPVFDYCNRRLGDHEAAADASSQVFAKALAGIHGFRSGSVPGWLFTIARNTVIDLYRTQRSQANLEAAGALVDLSPGPHDEAVRSEQRRALVAAVEQLTLEQQQIIELRWAGLSGPEIAAALGLTLSAVKGGQYRAFIRLRGLLSAEHFFEDAS